MKFESWSFTDADMQRFGNDVLECVLRELVSHGEIPVEKADTIRQNYMVVIARRSVFGAWWDRIFRKQDEDGKTAMSYLLVKVSPRIATEAKKGPEEP